MTNGEYVKSWWLEEKMLATPFKMKWCFLLLLFCKLLNSTGFYERNLWTNFIVTYAILAYFILLFQKLFYWGFMYLKLLQGCQTLLILKQNKCKKFKICTQNTTSLPSPFNIYFRLNNTFQMLSPLFMDILAFIPTIQFFF